MSLSAAGVSLSIRAQASGPFTCTQVIGFSQTAQWYADDPTFENSVEDDEWQLLWAAGGAIELWADPQFSEWGSPVVSPCGAGSTNPDRAIVNISGAPRTVPQWTSDIEAAIATVRTKYSNLQEIALQPVLGGPQEQPCPDGAGGFVRASTNHPDIDQAIANVIGGDVVAGASPEVTLCTDYSDAIGHLTAQSLAPIATSIASFYLNSGIDTDSDGCSDIEEDPANPPPLGGMRNPLFQYDFYDVNGSKKVDASDIGLVRAHFNPMGPVPPADVIYDRSSGAAPWAPGAPNGRINATDIALVRASFNHNCQAPP